jgi:hypothetical protein
LQLVLEPFSESKVDSGTEQQVKGDGGSVQRVEGVSGTVNPSKEEGTVKLAIGEKAPLS